MERKDILVKILFAAIVTSVFSLGFISAYLFMLIDNKTEMPFSFSDNSEYSAPSNTITERNIRVYEDKVVIYIDNAKLSRYADTGSMLPILDDNSNGIKITVDSEDDIKVGDIITYRDGADLIVHRVIEKGVDSKGVYFITKGDNNSVSDGKIRLDMIESKTIAIIY